MAHPFFQKPRNLVGRMLGYVLILFALPLLVAWWLIAQPGPAGKQRPLVAADRNLLRQHVKTLSIDFHPRNYKETANLDRCADYVFRHFQECGLETRLEEYTIGTKTYKNVIGLQGNREDLIVVGAHYDSCHETPGADDNASGVAGLLEIARLLKRQPLPCNIELVAYTLEEPPYFRSQKMGSAVHARHLMEAGVTVRGVLVLEMIGFFSSTPFSQNYPLPLLRLFYPNRGDFVVVAGSLDQRAFTRHIRDQMRDTSTVPVLSINAPRFVPGIDYSDHRNYWDKDLPAVMITDTSFYRNKHYHQEGDTWEKLDFERMAQVVEGVYGSLALSAAEK